MDKAGQGQETPILFQPLIQERLVLLAAVLLRVLVGLSPYSGLGDAPKFGDYEAQRHWMAIALHSPPSQWYQESSMNNISYWPLDYPPLSGYQSWAHGHFVQHFEPKAVELSYSSNGYETATSKRLLRATVLLSDLLLFFPLAVAASRVLYGPKPSPRRAFALACTLLNPALVIIDHGHFQYNHISLGFAVGGAAAIAAGWSLLGSSLFCAALNHKQMSLYFAPAFFAHLLGKCMTRRGVLSKGWHIIRLGAVVVLSFAVMWLPWLMSEQALREVVGRIFPLRRGLFEDYVANWWCVSSTLIKWKQVVPAQQMVMICMCATLAVAVPSMLHQTWRPSSRGLIVAMFNSASAFYMLAYQVHEKSVLLPLTPLMVLAGDYPTLAAWMPVIAMVSMYPLLERDGLTLPYIALNIMWGGLMMLWAPYIASTVRKRGEPADLGQREGSGSGGGVGAGSWFVRLLGLAFLLATLTCHVVKVVVPPPETLPWLYDRAFVTLAFAGLVLIMVYMQVAQWRLPPQVTNRWDEQESIAAKKHL